MSDKSFKPIVPGKKVDCNAPRTSPLFSWALCGMSGREKSDGKISNIKTSPITVQNKKGKGGKRKSRKKFKKHYMWNTKGKRYLAKTYKQHRRGVKLGHSHKKPSRKNKSKRRKSGKRRRKRTRKYRK